MLVLRGKDWNPSWSAERFGFERLLKITVLELKNGSVRLGFEVDSCVPVHRFEIWEKIQADGKPDNPLENPAAPVA